jgi:hypothetical protein|tara:strand:+ start:1485 stop:2987 length:1503 start_codon:yes stop_codon:yes gene_type:complete
MMNWNKILKEWSYRVGVIKPRDKKHLHQLTEILKEEGWPYTVVNEIVQNLTEAKEPPKKDVDLLKLLGMEKYPDKIQDVYDGVYKSLPLGAGSGETAFIKKDYSLGDLKLYSTKFDKKVFVTTAGSVKKIRSPYGIRIAQLSVSTSDNPTNAYFGKVYTLYQYVKSMGSKVELKDRLAPGIGYEKMQVDNMVQRMQNIFPMSDSRPLQLHIAGQDMGVDINSSIKVPGSPKADIALGQGNKGNFWISYKHGDYIDKSGKELPASFQQYGSLKTFFTKEFTNKAKDAGIEKLIDDFLDKCKTKATYIVKNVTGVKQENKKWFLQTGNKDWKEAPTQNPKIWGTNATWLTNSLKKTKKTNLHIVDKSGFSYRRALLNKGAAGKKIVMMSIFGEDYASGKAGKNNVDVLLQDSKAMDVAMMTGDEDLAVGLNIDPGNTGHYMLNPKIHGGGDTLPKFAKQYEPYLLIRFTGSMNIGWNGGNDIFIGARFLINPESQTKGGTDI